MGPDVAGITGGWSGFHQSDWVGHVMESLLIVLLCVVFIALLGVGVIAPVLAVFATNLGAIGE